TATRHPDKLQDLGERGAIVRKADFDDPGSLQDAFAGANRLLLVSTNAVDQPGKRLTQHRAAVAAAGRAGVKHVVFTSLSHADDSPVVFAPEYIGTEQAIKDSGMSWRLLRHSLYAEELLFLLAISRFLTHGG